VVIVSIVSIHMIMSENYGHSYFSPLVFKNNVIRHENLYIMNFHEKKMTHHSNNKNRHDEKFRQG